METDTIDRGTDTNAVQELVNGLPISRRSVLKTAGIAALAGGTLTKAVWGADETTPISRPALAQVTQASEYRGVAQTVVLAGDGLTTTEHRYEQDVVVVFGPPAGAQGGLSETNPFNLFVGPGDRNTTAQPGRWEIHSANLVGNVLFQYWQYEVAEDWTFTGTLTEPHNQEAIAANLLNVETPLIPGRPQLGVNTLPKAMGAGTQVSGAVSDDTVSIVLVGATIDGFTRFESRLEASRTA